MRKSRFTEEQIIGVFEGGGCRTAAKDLCRRHGISRETFYRWKSKYGGMDVSEARRLRQLEEENRQLSTWLPDHTSGAGHFDFYNRERAHQGYRTQGRTPYQAFLHGVAQTQEKEVNPEALNCGKRQPPDDPTVRSTPALHI